MKDENQLERDITKALKFEVGNAFEWMEWGMTEEHIKKNLLEGEKIIKILDFWVAYKSKKK